MKLSVIIPVFNEVATVTEIVRRVADVRLPAGLTAKEIIVVNDYSTDGTTELLGALELRYRDVNIIHHKKNCGKGAALRTGITQASGDIVLFQDADLEYDPEDYTQMLTPILRGKADVVYGSRFLTTSERRVLYFWHWIGNVMLTFLCNAVSDVNLTDMETCYKAFRREVLQGLRIEQDRFGCEPEITIKVAKNRWRIYEVGISYSGRTYEEGKKIGLRDAFKAVWCIVKYGFLVPRRKRPSVAVAVSNSGNIEHRASETHISAAS
jgi:glycosyltransferase involved in cell wall biosynthesis